MDKRDFKILLEKCLGSEASLEEQKAMVDAVKEYPEFRKIFVDSVHADVALTLRGRRPEEFARDVVAGIETDDRSRQMADQLQAELSRKKANRRTTTATRLPKRGNRLIKFVFAAAAVALFAALGVYFTSRTDLGPYSAELVLIREQALIGRNGKVDKAKNNAILEPGQWLQTEESGFARMVFRDQTTVVLDGDTKITLADTRQGTKNKAIYLDDGTILADVTRQAPEQPFVVTTPHAEIEVKGTRFRIVTDHFESKVSVIKGKVVVRNLFDSTELFVSADQTAIIRRKQPAELVEPRTRVLKEKLKQHKQNIGSAQKRKSILVVTNEVSGNRKLTNERVGRMLSRLRSFGRPLAITHYQTTTPFIFDDYALVVLLTTDGATTNLQQVNRAFTKHLARSSVPVLCCNPAFYSVLNLADTVGTTSSNSLIVIEESHKIAGLLRGRIDICENERTLTWARPYAGAKIIAQSAQTGYALLFVFEKDARKDVQAVPATRVAFPLTPTSSSGLTDNGWMLFDASVEWCLGENPGIHNRTGGKDKH